MNPQISVDSLAWEQAQLEIHLARNALGVALMRAQLYARANPDDKAAQNLAEILHDLKQHTEDALLKALLETPRTGR